MIMLGNKGYKRDILLKDLFHRESAAKYDTNPEPGIALETSESNQDKRMDTFYYISDSNGNMKWVFPSSSRSPLFLTFHNVPTPRARLYKLLVNIAFRLKLKKLVASGSLKFDKTQFSQLWEALSEIDFDDFALSFEEVRKSGKSLFAIGSKGRVTHWGRVAHTTEAEDEIENEMYALEILNQAFVRNPFYDSIATFSTPSVLVLDHRRPRRAKQSFILSREHIQLLVKLYEKYLHEFTVGDLMIYREMADNLSIIEEKLAQMSVENMPLIFELFESLKGQFEKLPTYYLIPVSFAHNDFTPWNIYKKSGKLHITGWEGAKESMPVLHDLYYFIYSSGALFNKKVDKVIIEVENALETSPMKSFLTQSSVNVSLHERIYLIHAGISAIKNYLDKPDKNLFTQQRWNFWIEALKKRSV